MRRENHIEGALLAIASAFLFAGAGAGVKIVSATLPNVTIVFFRNAFALLVLAPWILRRGLPALETHCFRLHLTRTLAGLAAMYCFFYAISRLHLGEAVLLNYTAPLFIPFIAAGWLGEAMSPRIGLPIGLGFAGVALILKPGAGFLSASGLVGLAGGVLTAMAFVGIRRLAQEEPITRIMFYFTALSTTVSAIPLFWVWTAPEPRLWIFLAVIGMLASGGQVLLTRAYSLAPASWIGPFSYATVVFAAFFGWILWNEIPDRWSIAGASLVCIAGILALRLLGRGGVPEAPFTEPASATTSERSLSPRHR